ncbi:hypothetical protein M407DRAFT_22151 [Tulasnella calospora MUT 4182]|uniref:Uncharacterized protein n=1 Tax=Tulasnella calospora MUT 4182 TaxID=1051891 RepID=A0A0C3M4X4_9AGAM|nr:hypothetical protein M407DRAFT_22151 [Tulasnella calospora MUT 4182]
MFGIRGAGRLASLAIRQATLWPARFSTAAAVSRTALKPTGSLKPTSSVIEAVRASRPLSTSARWSNVAQPPPSEPHATTTPTTPVRPKRLFIKRALFAGKLVVFLIGSSVGKSLFLIWSTELRTPN